MVMSTHYALGLKALGRALSKMALGSVDLDYALRQLRIGPGSEVNPSPRLNL